MPEKDKPLPKPPATPFGKKRTPAEAGEQGLMADKMAEAAALGRLDEYLERELPHNEQARALARMMMGMTGIMPGGGPTPQAGEKPGDQAVTGVSSMPPEDVVKAIQGGDVQGLMGLLRREYEKRNPGADTGPPSAGVETPATERSGTPAIDKALIDELIRIASDNSVTLDWIILRAIKVYVEEYRKTGKL
jgi:hypothetical protein